MFERNLGIDSVFEPANFEKYLQNVYLKVHIPSKFEDIMLEFKIKGFPNFEGKTFFFFEHCTDYAKNVDN